MAKLLAFAGSARHDSFNARLVNHTATLLGEAGIEVTSISLADYSMPIYDGDLEASEGLPENALTLKALFKEHDGFVIACPEYNGSISPLLKNTIDWVSRPMEGETPLEAYQGKVCGLVAASPGGLGGLRGLVHVRAILSGIGVLVVPSQVAVGGAHEALDESGAPSSPAHQKMLAGFVTELATVAKKIAG